MMKNYSPNEFESFLTTTFKEDEIPELISDEAFLQALNTKLNQMITPNPRSPYQIWFSGLTHGMTAAAAGIILIVGLNTIPPLLVRASVSNVGLVQKQVINARMQQQIFWQKLLVNLEQQRQKL